jgi:hypothetical protein
MREEESKRTQMGSRRRGEKAQHHVPINQQQITNTSLLAICSMMWA